MDKSRKRGRLVRTHILKLFIFTASVTLLLMVLGIIYYANENTISQSPSIIPGDADGDGFYDSEETYCGSNSIDILSTPQISCIVDKRLSESDQKEAVRSFLQNKKNTLPLWNNGADYSSTITSGLNSLPSGSKSLTIPPGRYKIATTLWFNTNENIVIQASQFGEVILEADGLEEGENVIHAFGDGTIILENLTFWGEKTVDSAAIDLFMDNSKIVSNAIINFDAGLILDPFGTHRGRNTIIANNYFFDNGYLTLRIDGGYNADTDTCTQPIGPFNLTGNFLSGNYQGINLKCAENGLIEDNIVRDSSIAGFRVESSKNNIFRHNMAHRNTLQGFWIYGSITNSIFDRNIVIDNNKGNQPFFFDCWTPQSTLRDDYLYNRPGLNDYPYLRQEGQSYLFTNYWCQFNGQEIELRNSIDENNFTYNIIGRYSRSFNNVNWESPLDIRVSYYPQFYALRPQFLSWDNIFENNYFVNADSSRILDGGCGNQYINNKAVDVLSDTETPFSFIPVEDPICAKVRSGTCSAGTVCNPCNANNICDPLAGENTLNCGDCKRIELGQSGTRQHNDQCVTGLNKTEAIFPANPGCINIYDGSFKCTDTDNGVFESQYGENYCNLPDTDHDGISNEWEIQYNLLVNSGADASLDPDTDGRTNLQEFVAGTNPLVADTIAPPIEEDSPDSGSNPGSIVPTNSQCKDGIDNDGDGLIDHPNDPGCSNREDNLELNVVGAPTADCIEDWECSPFSECLNGTQTRSCTEANNCGTSNDVPALEENCGTVWKDIRKEENRGMLYFVVIAASVIILAVIVSISLLIRKK